MYRNQKCVVLVRCHHSFHPTDERLLVRVSCHAEQKCQFYYATNHNDSICSINIHIFCMYRQLAHRQSSPTSVCYNPGRHRRQLNYNQFQYDCIEQNVSSKYIHFAIQKVTMEKRTIEFIWCKINILAWIKPYNEIMRLKHMINNICMK